MAKPALPWLTKLCKLYEKHDRSVYETTVTPHADGILIGFELDRGYAKLLVHRKGSSARYAETASFCVSIFNAQSLPGNGELVIRQFINVLNRADKGDIVLQGSR